MEGRNLKLVKNRRAKKIRLLYIVVFFVVIIGLGGYFLAVDFRIRDIEIKGNSTYTDTEILDAMKEDGYVGNTLLMIAQNQLFGQTYLPLIESVSMGYEDSHVLKVQVKEKLRAGVFKYMNQYVYFNEKGIAMESRNTLFDKVPVVTGVKFDTMELEKKIPVKENYFNTIVEITKKIATYKLSVSEIHFRGENDITLTTPDYKIYLGSPSYLEGKMSKIPSVIKALEKEKKKGIIDMHLYTDDKMIITFRKK